VRHEGYFACALYLPVGCVMDAQDIVLLLQETSSLHKGATETAIRAHHFVELTVGTLWELIS